MLLLGSTLLPTPFYLLEHQRKNQKKCGDFTPSDTCHCC